ncbi:MAG TPA: helix-turn-helix transcriptional regulator [Acidiferrobacter sp.]|nr:helix-turn-helix transcriptional regulator [Acidiferrobacter sp.]
MDNVRERSYLAINLRRVRLARGLTQDDVAAISGINRAYVSDLENRKRNIGIDCLGRLAAALKIPAAALLLAADDGPDHALAKPP